MTNIYVGKIVNTFGVKGELKISSNFDMPERVFVKDFNLFINDKSYTITNVRYHKEHYLVELDNIKDINDILYLKGNEVYIDRASLNLKDNEYILDDLIDMEIIDNNELLGKVTNYINDPKNPLIRIDNKFYIPLKSNFIKEINLKDNKIITENAKELII